MLEPVVEQTNSQQVLSMDLKIKSVEIVAPEKDAQYLIYQQKKEAFWKKVRDIEKKTKGGTPGEDSDTYGDSVDNSIELQSHDSQNAKYHVNGNFHVPRYSNTTLDELKYIHAKDDKIRKWPEARRNKAVLKLWKKAFVRTSGVVMFINRTAETRRIRLRGGMSDSDISE